MRKNISMMTASAVAAAVMVVGYQALPLLGQARQETRVAAVPNEKGGQDRFGAYEPVVGWPKPLSSRMIDIARRRAFQVKFSATGAPQKGTLIFDFSVR